MSTTQASSIESDSSLSLQLKLSTPVELRRVSSTSSVMPLHQWYLPVKWAVEYMLALCLFVISIPILIVAGLGIKATSKGPIFYLQQRVGLHGRIFRVIKLRTMVVDAESETGPVWSSLDDPRITPFGNFLRETHIDEFPQLVNVLLGQMALVGPRPERPEIVRKLERTIPNYRDRTNVRPGITGLSQMKLPPDSDFESVRQKQIFDLYYVTQVSAWLDVRILTSTSWLLLRAIGKGAFSMIALPPSTKVMSSIEGILGPDSQLLAANHRKVPPK